jgi:hypothetical protein
MKGAGRLRARLALMRQPARAVRLATALWLVLAVVVWNVIFDRVIVLGGRRYVVAASGAAAAGQPYVLIDPWMRPAITRGLWIASSVSLAILVFGLIAVRMAAHRDRAARDEEIACTPSPIR